MTTVSALISLQDALGAVMPGDQAVEMQIAKQVKGDLLDGGAEDELVTAYGQAKLTEDEVIDILSDAIGLAQKKGSGVASLSGVAEADVVSPSSTTSFSPIFRRTRVSSRRNTPSRCSRCLK